MKTTIKHNNLIANDKLKNFLNQFVKMNFLILLFLFLGFSSFAKSTASEISGKEKLTKEIRKQLINHIQFPSFMKQSNSSEESVNVLFKIQKDGSISIVKTDSKNESLNKFIEAELAKTKLVSLQLNGEDLYKINIRFKLL